jgi:hypothetical protein
VNRWQRSVRWPDADSPRLSVGKRIAIDGSWDRIFVGSSSGKKSPVWNHQRLLRAGTERTLAGAGAAMPLFTISMVQNYFSGPCSLFLDVLGCCLPDYRLQYGLLLPGRYRYVFGIVGSEQSVKLVAGEFSRVQCVLLSLSLDAAWIGLSERSDFERTGPNGGSLDPLRRGGRQCGAR